MTFAATSIIAGRPVEAGERTFAPIAPATGDVLDPPFTEASAADIDAAVAAAVAAAPALAATSPQQRADFLRAISAALEARRGELVPRADAESGLGPVRLEGELTRAIVQFEAFADLVATGDHLAVVIDPPKADARPAPRPDLRKMHVPLGPVAVFGASNFPFAFGTPGGDTASALAAGCPVVVKGHPAHPGTSELVALAIADAAVSVGLPAGVFSVLQGADPSLSTALVAHPGITAVGFTGSLIVGRILMDTAAARPAPITVHAEMGSVNPTFITSAAIEARCEAIAQGLAASLTGGAGQFCTKPGVSVVPRGEIGDRFVAALADAFAATNVHALLTPGIRATYERSTAATAAHATVLARGTGPTEGSAAEPLLLTADFDAVADHPDLVDEHFGPFGIVLRADEADFARVAAGLDGQLAAVVHAEDGSVPAVRDLIAVLSTRAGRVIWNGFPTGVAVAAAMTHGGPYPAASTPTTSVGLAALDRFVRPVTYQSVPEAALPPALVDANPWGLCRRIDGVWSDAPRSAD